MKNKEGYFNIAISEPVNEGEQSWAEIDEGGFIYSIINEVNSKIYIGQTTQKPSRRFIQHRSDLNRNKHGNTHLQSSWNKYGEDNFTFFVLEREESLSELNKSEKKWIENLNTLNRLKGYNIRGGGKNAVVSEETRKRMSTNHYDCSGEKNPFYGKTHTEESLNKMRQAKLGKLPSEATKKKMSKSKIGKKNPFYGKKHSKKIMDQIAKKNSTKCMVIETGEVFNNQYELAKKIGVSQSTVSRHCNKQVENQRFKLV